MATIKQVIGDMTGAGSRAGQFKKSAYASAKVFAQQDKNLKRRKSLGGKGG